jgi:DUF4097 and DUF4098 domain-containing protein YvlB
MRTEGVDIDFRFLEDVQSTENIRRIVIRVSEGDVSITASNDSDLRYSIELEGIPGEIDAWSCSVRRAESVAILDAMANDFVRIAKGNIHVPSHISDIEVHSSRGSIEVRDIASNILVISERGSITVSGAKFVEASSVSGSIHIENSEGCSVRSIDGNLVCHRISGSIQAEMQNGSITIDQVARNVAVVSDQGKISVRRVGGRVRLISNKGDIELEVSGSFGGGEIQTYSGDISIQLEHSSVEFRAETLSGRIDASHPVNSAGMGPQRCAFRTGDGARRLYVKSVLGDIEVN